MRWMREPGVLSEHRERGATAVLMGILMTGLVGFTGLAVDTGASVAKQQELQNGADAAALAAAQECAVDDTCAGIDAVAGPYGVDNVRHEKGSVTTGLDPDLSAQTVEATVTGTKTHWFLPVVGISSTVLDASATASWGTPQSGPAMLPLSVSMCSFEDAMGPDLDVQKDIFLNKGGSEDDDCSWGGTYPAGGFGWLAGADSECEVNVTVDSWVVADPGMDAPACAWASMIGQTVLIPVFSDRTEPSEGKNVLVEQFAAFELLGITPSNAASNVYGAACGPRPDAMDYHKACITGIFKEYVTSADGYAVGGEETEVTVISLTD